MVPTKIATLETLVKTLRSIFAWFGLTKMFVLDDGPQLIGIVFRMFLVCNNLQRLATALYCQKYSGLAERAVHVLKEGLKKHLGEDLKMRIAHRSFWCCRTPDKDGKTPATFVVLPN